MPIPEFLNSFVRRASPAKVMVTSYRGEHQYFRTWVSYSLPPAPREPIRYEDTRDSISYYLGHFDNVGRLTRFKKFIRNKNKINHNELVKKNIEDGYYEIISNEGNSSIRQIEFLNTEGMSSYVEVTTIDDSIERQIFLVDTQIIFDDQYGYYPNGKLKERLSTSVDGVIKQTFFDEHGREMRSAPLQP